MSERCETCRWWNRNHYNVQHDTRWQWASHGQVPFSVIKAPCVIRAPSAGFFPLTCQDDWCGEHQPTPKEPDNDER